ncbi:MAG: KH domain-containing protein [Acholeplasmatales bacterium]|jgi:predicted RNA-binding protein YlqC (UPF0109 family)|nr:KH domain-containing protein [Acholeplasmatales bacterium]
MAIDFEKLLKNIIVPLILHPENLEIVNKVNVNEITINLLLDKEDVGRVIGRNGKTANSIRNILYAAATLDKKRIHLDINSK